MSKYVIIGTRVSSVGNGEQESSGVHLYEYIQDSVCMYSFDS